MSLATVRPSPAMQEFLPVEYQDLIKHDPYGEGNKKTVRDIGKFKELIE